jgi:hypothetical protein
MLAYLAGVQSQAGADEQPNDAWARPRALNLKMSRRQLNDIKVNLLYSFARLASTHEKLPSSLAGL